MYLCSTSLLAFTTPHELLGANLLSHVLPSVRLTSNIVILVQKNKPSSIKNKKGKLYADVNKHTILNTFNQLLSTTIEIVPNTSQTFSLKLDHANHSICLFSFILLVALFMVCPPSIVRADRNGKSKRAYFCCCYFISTVFILLLGWL